MGIKSVEVDRILAYAHTRLSMNIQRTIQNIQYAISNSLYTNNLAPLDKLNHSVYIPLMTNFIQRHLAILLGNTFGLVIMSITLAYGDTTTAYFMVCYFVGVNLGYIAPRGTPPA